MSNPFKAEEARKKWLILGVSAAFILLNSLLIAFEVFYLPLLPALIAIFLLYLFSLDRVLLLITFLTPLAVSLREWDTQIGLSLPTEPLMAGVVIFAFIRFFYDWKIDRRVLYHPVSIAVALNLAWIFITSLTSELPIVSFKFLISRIWFVIPFYFLAIAIFKNPPASATLCGFI
jgi:putative inorganic carbon (hco3(-)) transporter